MQSNNNLSWDTAEVNKTSDMLGENPSRQEMDEMRQKCQEMEAALKRLMEKEKKEPNVEMKEKKELRKTESAIKRLENTGAKLELGKKDGKSRAAQWTTWWMRMSTVLTMNVFSVILTYVKGDGRKIKAIERKDRVEFSKISKGEWKAQQDKWSQAERDLEQSAAAAIQSSLSDDHLRNHSKTRRRAQCHFAT